MILPTFTDYDKEWEVARMCNLSYEVVNDNIDSMYRKLIKRKHFPTFESIAFDDDKNNRWIVTFYIHSKEHAKYTDEPAVFCYTAYDLPQKRGTNQSNAGKGILLFQPIPFYERLRDNPENCRASMIFEFTPHALNRYNERYLVPNGFKDLRFQHKIEKIVARMVHFDVLPEDKSAEKQFKEKGGISCYDAITREGGMFRGTIVSPMLVRLYTYISPKMMNEEQTNRVGEMVREFYKWRKDGRLAY